MSSNKVIKSVSFNVTKSLDAQLLKAVKRRNFSGYVKKLIAADINAKSATHEKDPQATPEQSSSDLLAQLKRGMR